MARTLAPRSFDSSVAPARRASAFASSGPGSATEATRQYHVTVEPTVLVLDASGRVVARHEGEAPDTIQAIRSSLDRLLSVR